MSEKIFTALDQITQEGIEAGMWSVYDLKDGVSTKDYFGTKNDYFIKGKVLIVYEDLINTDYYCIDFSTADYSSPCGDGQNIHFWYFEK